MKLYWAIWAKQRQQNTKKRRRIVPVSSEKLCEAYKRNAWLEKYKRNVDKIIPVR